jgi:hypothetical protein
VKRRAVEGGEGSEDGGLAGAVNVEGLLAWIIVVAHWKTTEGEVELSMSKMAPM